MTALVESVCESAVCVYSSVKVVEIPKILASATADRVMTMSYTMGVYKCTM